MEALLYEEQTERRVYREVVARWNAYVKNNPTVMFKLDDFLRYVLDVYASLEKNPDGLGAGR
ncbi:MAG TPA: hypothetical protein VII47_13575 [Actinomycetota bacterium]|jgi:hypothetical protein